MRFIRDKNGNPFGHCDDCNGQLRIGSNNYRKKKFAAMYPWAAEKAAEIPVTVTDIKTAALAPVAHVQEKPVSKQKASWNDALALLGGGK